MEMLCTTLSNLVATSHMWLLGTWSVAGETEEFLHFTEI